MTSKMVYSKQALKDARKLKAAGLEPKAEELPASVEGDLEPEVDVAVDEKLGRRIADVESGTVKLVPASDVFARVLRTLR